MELTRRVAELYDEIQGGIYKRYAMWVQDAVAWYEINFEMMGDTLEIGTAWGGSAIMARKAKEDAFRKNTIYTIDPLGGFYGKGKEDKLAGGDFPTVNNVECNFNRFNVSGIQLVLASTPPLPEELDGLMFGAVLIDGNHHDTGPLDDWNIVKDRVIIGGVVMFHDIHYPPVVDAVKEAENTPGWTMVRKYKVRGHGMGSQMRVKGNELYGSHAILRKDG